MAKSYNTEPYYDDFDETKGYHRILFRPGYAVQARELTQLQTILQNQITKFGNHVFKEGSVVIPGEASVDTKIDYVKLEATYGGVLTDTMIQNFLGKTIKSTTNSLEADVIWYSKSTGSDAPALFVRYKTAASDNETKVFSGGDIIEDMDGAWSAQVLATNATGKGSIASINKGVYFLKGCFVYVPSSTIVLDKFTNTPSYRIGLKVTEYETTAEEDASLFDNAQNTFNYSAPGAHRYTIGAELVSLPDTSVSKTWNPSTSYNEGDVVRYGTIYYKCITAGITGVLAPSASSGTFHDGTAVFQYFVTYDPTTDNDSDTDFIELIRTNAGNTQKQIKQTEYSILAKEFARRTYDESGNYTVRNFEIDVREYRDNNRGDWNSGVVYLAGDVIVNAGKTYFAKNSGTSVNNGESVPGPVHTSGAVYDGAGNTGIQWEYTDSAVYNRGVYRPATSSTLAENQAMEAKLAVGLEPGKAYVQGYEIEKVGTEFVTVDKARDSVQVSAETVSTKVGNYIKVTNIYGAPPLVTSNRFARVNLYDRLVNQNGINPATAYTSAGSGGSGATLVGTARVRFIELDSGTYGSSTAVYKLGLFDVQMVGTNDFNEKVKAIYYDNATGVDFTANVSPKLQRLIGSITTSAAAYGGGSAAGTYVTGNGTSFQTDLEAGDYILIGGTELARIDSIASQTTLRLTWTTTNAYSGAYYQEATTLVEEPESIDLLFPLGQSGVKSATDAGSTVDHLTYSVFEVIAGSIVGGQVQVSTSSGTMADGADNDQYMVIDTTSGAILPWSSPSAVGGQITLTVTGGTSGDSVAVVCQVNKAGATITRKAKTLVPSATTTFTTQATAQSRTLSLGFADGYRLISVKMKTGTFASPGSTYSIDVTDRYDFDNGQRDTHYDVAKLVLKGSYAPPEAPIQVTFDYFTHGSGDYFTVDSYPANIDYKLIPSYKGISLRDVLDFRPRIDNTGVNFTGTGAVTSLVPKRGESARVDYSYYLAKKTKIAVDFAGNFFNVDGVSSLNPGEPQDPSLGLVLYGLTLAPYTFGTDSSNVLVQKFNNKRYTMRDIGSLEKRIDNLEYYTSLSLLEQQTESLSIMDSSGNDRFKNGFIVDSFTGHNTGDTYNPDYLCSIDMEQGELRPFFSMHNVNLLEKATSNTDRAGSNYQLYGDVITLPVIDHIPFIKQEFASRLENINPFAVFTFLGDVKLNPSSDDWFEVDRRPDLVVDVEGNFNAIKAIAEKAGVLGTVWNAWQTQWTGATTTTKTITTTGNTAAMADYYSANGYDSWNTILNSTGGNISLAGNSNIYAGTYTVTTRQATQIGQSRTGVKTSLVTKIDRQVVGDRVLSTAAIPYMRSRNVLVQIQKLKPNSKFYPFFDGVDISAHCTPASKLVYNPTGGTFNTDVNVGGSTSNQARQIAGDTQVCLNRGDIITGGTSGATAVVVGKEYNADVPSYTLHIVNIKGTFQANETITGSVSSATGTVNNVTVASKGGSLVTNFAGEIQLLFNIPNTDSLRFRCGTREFKLVDVATADGLFTSRARANYRAEGTLETRQQTVHSVRNAELVEEQLSESRVTVLTSERVVSGNAYYDPLAQSFLIDVKGGCFLSKVDIFFATKDEKIPVTLEIRECINGYPGNKVLPFSRVTLKPEDVKISGNTVPLADGTTANKYDTATTFTFPSPVYVQEGTEYALVLSSDSNAYHCWVSQLGELMPGTARTISDQPYLGSLFKSQNAFTWTADQSQDLMFRIYRAQFNTSVIGNVEYVNDVNPFQTLDYDPLETRLGVSKIRVWQKDHGFPSIAEGGTFVTITDSNRTTKTGTITVSTSSATVTGSGTAFTTDLAVGDCLYYLPDDNYYIGKTGTYIGKVSAIANNTSLTLSANSGLTKTGIAYVAKPIVNGIPANEIYGDHTVNGGAGAGLDQDSYVINTTTAATGTGYGGGTTLRATRHFQYDAIQPSVSLQAFSETPVSFGVKTITGKSTHSTSQIAYTQDVDFSGVLVNETNYFNKPRMVASQANEDVNTSSEKSLAFNITMTSTNETLSPIIDTHRTSMIVINNKVNYPTETLVNVESLDYNSITGGTPTSPTAVSGITISGSTITTSTRNGMFLLAKVGKYLTITPATGTATTALVTAVATDGSSITFDRSLASGSGNVSLVLRERFVAENAPDNSATTSKYVTRKITLADTSRYIRINFAVNLPSEAGVEIWYRTSPVGFNGDFISLPYKQITTADAAIINAQNETNAFFDASFSATETAFDAIQVKIVMKSINSSQVPRLKDLRIICCD